jgi:hypothetical protein
MERAQGAEGRVLPRGDQPSGWHCVLRAGEDALAGNAQVRNCLVWPTGYTKNRERFQDRLGTNAQTQGKHPTKRAVFLVGSYAGVVGGGCFHNSGEEPTAYIPSESAPIRPLLSAMATVP